MNSPPFPFLTPCVRKNLKTTANSKAVLKANVQKNDNNDRINKSLQIVSFDTRFHFREKIYDKALTFSQGGTCGSKRSSKLFIYEFWNVNLFRGNTTRLRFTTTLVRGCTTEQDFIFTYYCYIISKCEVVNSFSPTPYFYFIHSHS